MLIGLVGAPNKGKSTIFSALTMMSVAIADYPFTTINPNLGLTYATKTCVETELKVKCKPRDGLCINGIRQLPVRLVDVAGLVPGASIGKGMGSQFLNDLAAADVLIHVIDSSGSTDLNGNPAPSSDPAEEVRMVAEEMAIWLSNILIKHMPTIAKRNDGIQGIKDTLSSFNATENEIKTAAEKCGLVLSRVSWTNDAALRFSKEFLKLNKPTIVAANKLDICKEGTVGELKSVLGDYIVVGCSGAIELALKKADKSGGLSYTSSTGELKVTGTFSPDQQKGIEYMNNYLKKYKTTGIQELVNTAVFNAANKMVVYPVQNDNKYTDNQDNILPDAFLVDKNITALGLAERIHTDIAKTMMYAVDARTKNRVSKDQQLKDNDIIKIVNAAK